MFFSVEHNNNETFSIVLLDSDDVILTKYMFTWQSVGTRLEKNDTNVYIKVCFVWFNAVFQ